MVVFLFSVSLENHNKKMPTPKMIHPYGFLLGSWCRLLRPFEGGIKTGVTFEFHETDSKRTPPANR